MDMNCFDYSILSFLNGFSRRSMVFDLSMKIIQANYLLKGGIFMILIWWFWFEDKKPDQYIRERIIVTMSSGLIALWAARVLAWALPFRVRPLHNADLEFLAPYGGGFALLETWSSFPSDHAILFFSLATGIFLISRKTGIVLMIYTLVVICFPRIYLGLHYPTDVLAGIAAGASITVLVSLKQVRRFFLPPVLIWQKKNPGSFYAFFFFLSLMISTMFDPVRTIGRFICQVCRAF